MALTRDSAPQQLPVTLIELRAQLREPPDREDMLLERLIAVATERAERELRRALITQTWTEWRDGWPCGGQWVAPKPPLQAVTAVAYTDALGAAQTLAPSVYTVVAPAGPTAQPGRLVLRDGQTWPDLARVPQAVGVTFRAGYGDSADAVPEAIRHGILLLASHLYEHREPVLVGTISSVLPMTVDYLWSPYRIRRWEAA